MSKKSKLLLRITLLFLLILVTAIFLLAIYAPTGEIHQTSLPDVFHPTAEYLLETIPINESIQITDDISLLIYYREYSSISPASVICILTSVSNEADLMNYQWNSRIYVNGEHVRGFGSTVGGFIGWRIVRCVEGNLEAGLHLIEFHLRDSFWGEPIAIQQWAIEIE